MLTQDPTIAKLILIAADGIVKITTHDAISPFIDSRLFIIDAALLAVPRIAILNMW